MLEHIKALLHREEVSERRRQLVEQLATLRSRDLSLILSQWLDAKMALESVEKNLKREEQACEQLSQQVRRTDEEIKRMREEIPKLQQQINELNRRVALREARIKTLQERDSMLLAQLEQLENKALEKGDDAKAVEARKAFFENSLALQVAKALLEKDRQTATKIQETISSYQVEVTRLENEKPQLEQQLLESYKRVEFLRAELKRLQKLEGELRERKEALEKEVSKIQAEIHEIESELGKR